MCAVDGEHGHVKDAKTSEPWEQRGLPRFEYRCWHCVHRVRPQLPVQTTASSPRLGYLQPETAPLQRSSTRISSPAPSFLLCRRLSEFLAASSPLVCTALWTPVFLHMCLLFFHFPLSQLGQIQNCAGLGTHLDYCLVSVTKIPSRNSLKRERPASVPGSRRFQLLAAVECDGGVLGSRRFRLVAAVECDGGVSRHSGPGNRTICSQRSRFECPRFLLASLLFLKVPQHSERELVEAISESNHNTTYTVCICIVFNSYEQGCIVIIKPLGFTVAVLDRHVTTLIFALISPSFLSISRQTSGSFLSFSLDCTHERIRVILIFVRMFYFVQHDAFQCRPFACK